MCGIIFYRSRTVRKHQETMIALGGVLQATTNALNGIQIPGPKSVLGALLSVVIALEKSAGNPDEITELTTQMQRLTACIIRPLEGLETIAVPRNLLERIGEVNEDWILLSKKWGSLSTESGIRRFFNRAKHAEAIADISNRIKQSLDHLQLEGNIMQETIAHETRNIVMKTNTVIDDTMASVTVTKDVAIETKDVVDDIATTMRLGAIEGRVAGRNVENVKEIVISERLAARLEKLPNDHGAYDLINQGLPPSKCFEGTREKLIADIMTWFHNEDPATPQFFFLNGIAGIGKSTVASTVCSLADESKELGASHFFSRLGGRTNPANVFTSFAYQLAKQNGPIKSEIAQALEDDPDVGLQAIKNQLLKLIVKPRSRLHNPPSQLLVVMDALDECQEVGAAELLSHLLSQLATIPFLRVLITGRPEHHITSMFSRRNHQRIIMHNIEDHIVQRDIEMFLRGRFKELQGQFLGMGIQWKWTEEQLRVLVKRSGKLFVYAVTVYKYISDRILADPEAQMKILLDAKTLPNPFSPYADLDALYLQLLHIIIPPTRRDVRLIVRFQKVIGTLVTLIEPLPIESLSLLSHTPESQVRVVLNQLPSVISTSSEVQLIPQIYHPSFPDFLKDPTRCTDEDLLVDPSLVNAHLAANCLKLMTSNLKRDMCGIKDPSKANGDVEGLNHCIKSTIPAWLRYACIHWGEHVAKAKVGDPEIKEHLEEFCRRGVVYWLEVLSLLGCLERATSFLEQIREWAEAAGCSETVLGILYDLSRIIPMFFDAINYNALHIYHSVIPFLPISSKLYEVYQNEAQQSAKVIKGRGNGWDPLICELKGHNDRLSKAHFSPNGKQIVTASEDGTARIWNPATNQIICTLNGHTGPINSPLFSPNGKQVVTASLDKTARIWDPITGQTIFTLHGHTGWVNTAQFSLNGEQIVTASRDKTARIWDSTTGQTTCTLHGHTEHIDSAQFSPNQKQIVTASRDRTARIWDSITGRTVFTLGGHNHWVVSAQFSPNGEYIVTASYDNTGRIWDSTTGQTVFILSGHNDWVRSAQFSQNGNQIVTASKDHTARIWDSTTGETIYVLKGHTSAIYSAQFSPNAKRVLTASYDETVRIWDPATGQTLFTLDSHDTQSIDSAQFSPNGKHIVTASRHNTARIWDLTAGQTILTLDSHTRTINSAQFSLNGNQILTSSKDHTARIWDSTTGETIYVLKGHTGAIYSAQFSPDGKQNVTTSRDGTARIWNSATGHNLFTLSSYTETIVFAQFSPSGKQIITVSEDHNTQIWDSTTGRRIFTLDDHTKSITSARFSPNGEQIVTISHDGIVRIWDPTTGQNLFALDGYTGPIVSAQFSSNGKQIMTKSWDNTTQIWDSATGHHVDTFLVSTTHYSAEFIGNDHALLNYGPFMWSLASPPAQRHITTSPTSKFRYTIARVDHLVGIYCDFIGPSGSTVSSSVVCWIPSEFGSEFGYSCHDHTLFVYFNRGSDRPPSVLLLDLSPLLRL